MGSIEEQHEPGVAFKPNGQKSFIPLENNPEVFTELVHRLGVSPDLGFFDVYSTDPELLAFVPRPAYALIFIAPGDVFRRLHKDDAPKEFTYDGAGDQEPVVWMKQTIGNACGLMALLHSVANGKAKQFVTKDSSLDQIIKDMVPLKPGPRADVLYNSAALEKAHMAVARKGDTAAPPAEDHVGYHFISFVKGNDGNLYELNGGWDGPINCGKLGENDDCLSEKAIELGAGRYVKVAEGNLGFSMVALAKKPE